MAITAVPEFYLPSARYVSSTFGGTMVIDASGEKWAYVFRVPKSGNIDRVGFVLAGVTTSETLRVGLETVDATTGAPTGTQYGGSAVGTQTSPAASTAYEVTLATPAAATAGDIVAIVIQFDSSVGSVQIRTHGSGQGVTFPYGVLFTSAWAKDVSAGAHWIRYDDGSYPNIGCGGWSALTYQSINTGTTPDEIALKFKFPFALRVAGCWVAMRPLSNTALFDVVLYDSDGSSVLKSVSVDPDQLGSFGSDTVYYFIDFASAQDLVADTYYRLALKPTTANSIRGRTFSVHSAGVLDSLVVDQTWHHSERTDAGAWTDSTTSRLLAGLRVTGIDGGGGSCDYPSEDDVRDGVTFNSGGSEGNLVLPAEEDVEDGVMYGTDGTEFEGTLEVGGGGPGFRNRGIASGGGLSV